MNSVIGWGFIGAGGITKRVINDLKEMKDGRLAAVYSRTGANAEQLATPYGAKAYTDCEMMIRDPEVDAIYVATPHHLHMEHACLALTLGKPVLCEKPLAPNAAQVRAMVEKSRETGTYLMEAMWTRFFPVTRKVMQWVSEGAIGDVHYLTADFGFSASENPESRLFNPATAGGSLLDVGVYAVSYASMIFGSKPVEVLSRSRSASTGVDSRMACLLEYENGQMASLFSSISTSTPQEVRIIGTKGHIEVPRFWSPTEARLFVGNQLADECKDARVGEGFRFEFEAVQEDLRAGRKENALMTHDESIAIAETLDQLRAQWGLVYPFEA
ncbi:Gfo/Idh/MocA family oxidoreductase [Paenibacillus rhizovicinus]|uniref:Gfo/Idh/MocA family oxidoreductase n=1 Tax=Paenibacillus rhizovicinus TaxID=2704463 RepID=A0A6C0NTX8_9BACL|nr:Gfo/Idh/MocA family oxidoreductase [Paenibacillus rhizovicinus]QHW29674.1 Gfo/Idh/MocA family oxidoreductase [Paenibacillus rhizovicinus]